jgi:hypothetical protein
MNSKDNIATRGNVGIIIYNGSNLNSPGISSNKIVFTDL